MELFRRLRAWWRRDALGAEGNAEFQIHIEARTEELAGSGLTQAEAMAQAKREFGNLTRHREANYESHGLVWLDSLAKDLHYSVRRLRMSPGFAACAVLSLSLGIGANTAVFQLLNAVRLRSLPVQRPSELVEIAPKAGQIYGVGNGQPMSYPIWKQVHDHGEPFSGSLAWGFDNFRLGSEPSIGPRRRLRGAFVSGEAFATLGVQPLRGRVFDASDDRIGCTNNGAVVSYGFWKREMGGSESAVGTLLILDDQPFHVIGITPPSFFGIEVGKPFEAAVPLCAKGLWGRDAFSRSDVTWLNILARLKPGWSLRSAASYVEGASAAWLTAETPQGYDARVVDQYRKLRLTATAANNGICDLRSYYGSSLWLLLGITTLVLAIACANLANLLLARATAARREIAVRMAIGASRGRLLRQLTTESLIIGSAAALLGIILAPVLSRLIVAAISSLENPIDLDLTVDLSVLAYTAVATLVASLSFGLSTAFASTRSSLLESIGWSAKGTASRGTGISFQRMLVVTQIAICFVLVVSSLLFVRTFRNLVGTDAGFRQQGIAFTFVHLDSTRISREAAKSLVGEILREVRSVPGIESASTTTIMPLSGNAWTFGMKEPGSAEPTITHFTSVSPGYFSTMGMKLLSGRDLDDQDTASRVKVVVASEAAARRIFGTPDAVGKSLITIAEPGYPQTAYQVVGVVKDSKYSNLREKESEIEPAVFGAEAQNSSYTDWDIVTHSSLPFASVAKAVEGIALKTHPGIRIERSVDFRSSVIERLARERVLAYLSGFFGLLAVTLAAIGLYGIVSYVASGRRGEIGIRVALGATPLSVTWLMMKQVVTWLAVGLLIGLAGARAIAAAAEALMYGFTPSDPVTYVGAGAALTLTVLAASLWPVRRASGIDPSSALRQE